MRYVGIPVINNHVQLVTHCNTGTKAEPADSPSRAEPCAAQLHRDDNGQQGSQTWMKGLAEQPGDSEVRDGMNGDAECRLVFFYVLLIFIVFPPI